MLRSEIERYCTEAKQPISDTKRIGTKQNKGGKAIQSEQAKRNTTNNVLPNIKCFAKKLALPPPKKKKIIQIMKLTG